MAGETRIDQIEGLQEYLDRATPDSYDSLNVDIDNERVDIRGDQSQIFMPYDLENEGVNVAVYIDDSNYTPKPGCLIIIPFISNADNVVNLGQGITRVAGQWVEGSSGDVNVLLIFTTAYQENHYAIWLNETPKHQITMSTSNASGGRTGDIHFKYE